MKCRRLSRRGWIRLAVCSVPAVVVADAAVIEPRWIRVRRLRLGGNEPAARFVHFTDLHHKGNRSFLEAMVAKINRLEPEFVCFTGDIVEDVEFLAEALEGLREIKAPVYGVPGNHDYWCHADFDEIERALAATGGGWLLDRTAAPPGGRVQVAGASCRHPFALAPKAGVRNVALIHYPSWVENLRPHRFDVVLAGHSHGGQVRLPWIGPLVRPYGVEGFDLGLFQTPAGPLYVGAGIGWFYLNVRFLCRPEITLVEV
ncbi:MAG TPA: metallophosphoesterase [Verrucomicrobiota bacterium]|nr:metallophosphoesterase [Verrucomicrobiota bacterium]